MMTTRLLGALFLVSSVFMLTQSPGWQFGYMALSGAFGFVGMLLVARRRSPCSRGYLQRTKRSFIEANAAR